MASDQVFLSVAEHYFNYLTAYDEMPTEEDQTEKNQVVVRLTLSQYKVGNLFFTCKVLILFC